MKKTKLTAILLAALICCSTFAGCNDNSDKPDKDSSMPEAAVTKPVTPEEMQDLIDQGIIPDTGDTSEVSNDNIEAPAPYTKGKVEGNVYTNEAANLTLRIPAGWNVADDYELSTLMNITYNFEDYDAYLAEVAKATDIFDFYAKDAGLNSSIMILFQDMAQYKNMTDVEFLEMQKASLITESATFEKSDVTEMSYSGNKYAMLKVDSTPNEGEKVTQYFFARIVDGRMMSIMITSPYSEPINPDTIFA